MPQQIEFKSRLYEDKTYNVNYSDETIQDLKVIGGLDADSYLQTAAALEAQIEDIKALLFDSNLKETVAFEVAKRIAFAYPVIRVDNISPIVIPLTEEVEQEYVVTLD